jgi:8-oxo-dGTP diphosphatase
MHGQATPIAIAVVEQDDRFLVGLRAADQPLGGLWEFPGGRLEPGETPEEAAVRECREEAGIDIEVVKRLGRWTHDYPHAQVDLHFFTCRPVAPQREVQEPFRWVHRNELLRLQMPPANRPLLQLLCGT